MYGDYIFWTDWVRRAVLRANKYGSDMKVLRADIPQQPMGIIAVAKDTNSCKFCPEDWLIWKELRFKYFSSMPILEILLFAQGYYSLQKLKP